MNYVTGSTIRLLREKQGLTQRQLHFLFRLCDRRLLAACKAVSRAGRAVPLCKAGTWNDLRVLQPPRVICRGGIKGSRTVS